VSAVQSFARVQSIPGWMRPEDADKLWELASVTTGPILEIGTFHGKSAVLMALALKDANTNTLIYTLEVQKASIRAAAAQAAANGVADRIVFVRGTSDAFARAYPWLRPALTFVDGDHRRAGVQADLEILERIVPAGGVLLFHDFDDPLNDDPGCADIEVRPTVHDSWVARECDFGGTFGACGLYTRRTDPPAAAAAAAAEDAMIVDLLRVASPADQYRHRLRYPAGRVWKRVRGARLA
jgi:predicted O-methyltransferase YrrM